MGLFDKLRGKEAEKQEATVPKIDWIAEKFSVDHQSPQLLAIKNGAVVASASHYDLVEIDLEKMR